MVQQYTERKDLKQKVEVWFCLVIFSSSHWLQIFESFSFHKHYSGKECLQLYTLATVGRLSETIKNLLPSVWNQWFIWRWWFGKWFVEVSFVWQEAWYAVDNVTSLGVTWMLQKSSDIKSKLDYARCKYATSTLWSKCVWICTTRKKCFLLFFMILHIEFFHLQTSLDSLLDKVDTAFQQLSNIVLGRNPFISSMCKKSTHSLSWENILRSFWY